MNEYVLYVGKNELSPEEVCVALTGDGRNFIKPLMHLGGGDGALGVLVAEDFYHKCYKLVPAKNLLEILNRGIVLKVEQSPVILISGSKKGDLIKNE